MHVAPPARTLEGVEVSPARILLVDDHRVFLDALAAILNAEPDLQVVGMATSAAQAEAIADVQNPELILLDVDLGTTDGIQLAQKLREDHPQARVAILTCHEDAETACAAVRAGASAVMSKGLAVEDLLRVVRGVHRGESWIPPRTLTDVLRSLLSDPNQLSPEEEKVASLSDREREVLACLVAGHDKAHIARQLYVSPNTVRTHVRNVLKKLGAHSSLEAVAVAYRAGLRATVRG
jgi:DNA-binding NarL/FixJ family response regulator